MENWYEIIKIGLRLRFSYTIMKTVPFCINMQPEREWCFIGTACEGEKS